MIEQIMAAVSIPVMAKARIGHFVEAQVLEALEVDYVDESEVLTPADEEHHIDKWAFRVPFVCGCRNVGEALRRIGEGAAMIRTKGEAGTGDIVNAVRHMRAVFGGIRRLQGLAEEELFAEAKNLQAPYELVRWVAEHGRLPVVTFTAGGIATPAFHWPGYAPPCRSYYDLAVDNLSRIGVNVELKPQEYGAYISTCFYGKFDSTTYGPQTPRKAPVGGVFV